MQKQKPGVFCVCADRAMIPVGITGRQYAKASRSIGGKMAKLASPSSCDMANTAVLCSIIYEPRILPRVL